MKKNPLFEIRKHLGQFDVSVVIEAGKGLAKGSIDFTEKKVDIRITPEGIKKGLEAMEESLDKFNNKWEAWLQRKKSKK